MIQTSNVCFFYSWKWIFFGIETAVAAGFKEKGEKRKREKDNSGKVIWHLRWRWWNDNADELLFYPSELNCISLQHVCTDMASQPSFIWLPFDWLHVSCGEGNISKSLKIYSFALRSFSQYLTPLFYSPLTLLISCIYMSLLWLSQ